MQEKPFRCPLCERCFGQQTNLDRHLKKHESDGPNVLDSPPPELDLDLASGGAQSPAAATAADSQRDAYFNEIRQFIGQACGAGRNYPRAPALGPAAGPPNRWFLQQAGGRYGTSEGRDRVMRSPCDLATQDDELDWGEDGVEATATRVAGSSSAGPLPPPLNGSWPGHHRLMAALGGVVPPPTSGSATGGGRTMLHNLLAMTAAGASADRAYPSTAVSPPVKSPTRPSSSALKQTSNVALPCVF